MDYYSKGLYCAEEPILIWVFVLIFLIFLSTFFSATETAFTSLSGYQVEEILRKTSFIHRKTSYFVRKRDELLATILVGNTISNIGASAITTVIAVHIWGDNGVSFAAGFLTLFVLVFCEVGPKQFALKHNESLALVTAIPLWIFNIILRPIVLFVSLISSLVNFLTREKKTNVFSLEHLFFLVRQGEAHGMVENYEKKLVHNVFRLSEISTTQIMTHRKDIFSLSANLNVNEAIPKLIEKEFSRIPIYKKDPEDIIGLVYLNEIYKIHIHDYQDKQLKDCMHKATFIPATLKVTNLLQLFKKESLSIAIALDEYGGLAGIVSKQDILEEILGELSLETEDNEVNITKINNGWRLPGDTPLHWLEEFLDHSITHDKAVNTMSGYLSEQLGRLPLSGEFLDLSEGRFHIEEVRENRVYSVCFYPLIEIDTKESE